MSTTNYLSIDKPCHQWSDITQLNHQPSSTRESRKAALTLFWMQYSCTGSSGIPWSDAGADGSSSSGFSAFFQCCYYSRQQHPAISTEKNQKKHGLPPIPPTLIPPACTSPGLGFPWHSWTDKEHIAPQSNNKLFSSLMPNAEVLFPLLCPWLIEVFLQACNIHQQALDRAERSWLVTLFRVIILYRFLQVSWIRALILLSRTLLFLLKKRAAFFSDSK